MNGNQQQQQHQETEWEAVQKRFGNLGGQAPLPPAEIPVNEDTLTQYTVSVAERMAEQQRAREAANDPDKSHDKDEDDLDKELEDMDPEEREFFEQYRQQRMSEMRAAQGHFGRVAEVTAQSFVSEVTEASKRGWVVVMLGDENRPSELLNSIFAVLAAKFPQVKFVHGIAAQCMPKVPVKMLPILLIYKNGKIAKQEFGMATFGGARATPDGKHSTDFTHSFIHSLTYLLLSLFYFGGTQTLSGFCQE